MNTVSILIITLVLLGCSTAYQSDGFTGGYIETRLAPDIYEVTFNGNGYTSARQTKDFAMLRAAELCQKNGYKYFVVIGRENSVSKQTYQTAGQTYTTYPAHVNGTYYGSSINVPGQTYEFEKPSSDMTIKMLKDKPVNVDVFFDAAYIISSLKSQYNIE